MKKPAADNPILNGPYDEPAYHYSTDANGNLNYADIRDGRRVFAPDVPQIPLNQSPQGSMFDLNDSSAEYRAVAVGRLFRRHRSRHPRSAVRATGTLRVLTLPSHY